MAGWGLPIAMVHGDAGFSDLGLIRWLEARGWPYCLGVRSTCTVYLPGEELDPPPPPAPYAGRGRPPKPREPKRPLHTVAEIRGALEEACWRRVAYRRGVDGCPLEREFAALRVCPATREQLGREAWLLLERPLDPQSEDTKQYLIAAPATASLEELARLAHVRPRIERGSYPNAKDVAGLDDYQGRSWPGLHRHLAMVWLALTWLSRQRSPLPPDDDPPSPPGRTQASPTTLDNAGSPSSHPTGPSADPTATVIHAWPEPPASVDQPETPLALQDRAIPVRCAVRGSAGTGHLPRQAWESLQAAHRRFLDWCRAAVIEELLLLGQKALSAQLQTAFSPP